MLCVTIASASGFRDLHGEDFRLLAWNVESNRPSQPAVSDAAVIGAQLSQLLSSSSTRSQVIALSEVEPKTFHLFVEAVRKGLDSEVDYVTSPQPAAIPGYRFVDVAGRQEAIQHHGFDRASSLWRDRRQFQRGGV